MNAIAPPARCLSLAPALLLALVVSTGGGCAIFSPETFDVLGTKKKVPIDPAKMVTVEMQADSSDPKTVPLAHEDTMLVQNALEKSGAVKRFGRMKVSLVRQRPDGRGPYKMDLKYDSTKRKMMPETDYALLPGDKIVAVEMVNTPIDDALEQLTGPLNVFSGKR